MKTQTQNKRSFRLTGSENEVSAIENLLKAEGYFFENDTFYPLARRCIHEPQALGSSLANYFGLIYIQDRASMLPPVALNPEKDSFVLDMCASPGSKTSMLCKIVGNKGLVIGNEPNPNRLNTLRKNLENQNCLNAVTSSYNGEKFPLEDNLFPHILLDPPCSGWGTIEKNPKVKEIWTEEKSKTLVALQKQLLKEAVRLLAPGGTLTYSTCTTHIKENEEQVLFAMNELGLELIPLSSLADFELDTPLLNLNGVWRLEPKKNDTQGFFVAKFKKKGTLKSPLLNENPLDFNTVLSDNNLEAKYNGKVAVFNSSLHFIPQLTQYLPATFRFQGMYLGKYAGDNSFYSPKLRMIKECDSREKIILDGKEGIQKIRAFLQGQSYQLDDFNLINTNQSVIALYWENLLLGYLNIKKNRLLWTK